MKLNNNDLLKIEGGVSISGAIVNAFVKGINTILDLGRSLGTSLRRIRDGKICDI